MDTPSSSMRDLARRLLAASQSVSDPHVPEAVLVSDRLRTSLTRFAGADGFTSLLRRALALARAEVPSLQSVKVGADGRLEGFEQQKSGEWRVASRTRTNTSLLLPHSPLTIRHSTPLPRGLLLSQRICLGCWSPSSANHSRWRWCARLGLTYRWMNSVFF